MGISISWLHGFLLNHVSSGWGQAPLEKCFLIPAAFEPLDIHHQRLSAVSHAALWLRPRPSVDAESERGVLFPVRTEVSSPSLC